LNFDAFVNAHDRWAVTPTHGNPPRSPFNKGGGQKG
jgi:hypothetical protein